MRCPYCHDDNDKVIDSRATDGGKAIRRRRECVACGKRFTTYEHVERNSRIMVIKKDDSRVPYDRQKVLAGLEKACYKRPIAAERLEKMVDEIEEKLFQAGRREVAAMDIGRMVAERLKRLDPVAYIRFASVYMQLRNLDDLMQEAREVQQQVPPPIGPNQGQLF
ncbi:MAG: transcriptional repressor NrdR [Phycisphaeraceae bacterium]|nr:transcriptional repressor NrdR [Phycisphaeraceae bacterium]